MHIIYNIYIDIISAYIQKYKINGAIPTDQRILSYPNIKTNGSIPTDPVMGRARRTLSYLDLCCVVCLPACLFYFFRKGVFPYRSFLVL